MPDWSHEIRERLAGLKVDPAREASIVEEIAQHLDDRYAELARAAAPRPRTARRSALDELAGPALAAALADARFRARAPRALPPAEDGGGRLSGLAKDFRYGARRLRLEPCFALVAILSLALGIGANTAIFQLLDAVRLRSLPVERSGGALQRPHRARAAAARATSPGRWPQLTSALWERIRVRAEGLLEARRLELRPGQPRVGRRGALSPNGLWVSGTFFDTVGVGAAAGPRPRPRRRHARAARRPPSSSASASGGGSSAGGTSRPGETLAVEGRRFEIAGVTPAALLRHGGRPRLRRRAPDLRRGSHRRDAPHAEPLRLVARRGRPARARLDAREGKRAPRRDLEGHLRVDAARGLRRRGREELSRLPAHGAGPPRPASRIFARTIPIRSGCCSASRRSSC